MRLYPLMTQLVSVHKVLVPCPICNRVFHQQLSSDIVEDVDRFPFPIVCMHTAGQGGKEVHTMVAYVDKQLKCRHVESLPGKRVFITPYIMYNPSLLQLQCGKTLAK